MRKSLIAILGMGLLFGLNCAVAQPKPDLPVSSDVYLHPQKLVSVGGRKINLYCVGTGAPTVLLDSGLRDGMLPWRLVQMQIAQFTRVCAYDRAGYGFSDASPDPSDPTSIVEDLHKLIHASGMGAPVLYVGHSIAGLYGPLLQAKHPEDVAGEVLVDPSFFHQDQAMMGSSPELLSKAWDMNRDLIGTLHSCLSLSQKGKLTDLGDKTVKNCIDLRSEPAGGDSNDPVLRRAIFARAIKPDAIKANISQVESYVPAKGEKESTDDRELAQIKVKFGIKPVTVLTRGAGVTFPGATAAQNTTMDRAWRQAHDQLAALSTNGKSITVPNSNHYIQLDQPTAVVSAVRDVVNELRQGDRRRHA